MTSMRLHALPHRGGMSPPGRARSPTGSNGDLTKLSSEAAPSSVRRIWRDYSHAALRALAIPAYPDHHVRPRRLPTTSPRARAHMLFDSVRSHPLKGFVRSGRRGARHSLLIVQAILTHRRIWHSIQSPKPR